MLKEISLQDILKIYSTFWILREVDWPQSLWILISRTNGVLSKDDLTKNWTVKAT